MKTSRIDPLCASSAWCDQPQPGDSFLADNPEVPEVIMALEAKTGRNKLPTFAIRRKLLNKIESQD